MKANMKRMMISLCSMAIALAPFIKFKGSSLLFFGEPEYPAED